MIAPLIPATSAPSKSRRNTIRLTVAGLASWDVTTMSVVIGKTAGSAPGVYTDLVTPTLIDDVTDFESFSYVAASGTLTVQIQDSINISSISAYATSNHLWVCLFETLVPSGSDPVIAAFDAGAIVA